MKSKRRSSLTRFTTEEENGFIDPRTKAKVYVKSVAEEYPDEAEWRLFFEFPIATVNTGNLRSMVGGLYQQIRKLTFTTNPNAFIAIKDWQKFRIDEALQEGNKRLAWDITVECMAKLKALPTTRLDRFHARKPPTHKDAPRRLVWLQQEYEFIYRQPYYAAESHSSLCRTVHSRFIKIAEKDGYRPITKRAIESLLRPYRKQLTSRKQRRAVRK